MTSKKWALQLDSEDEEKGANLKEKSSPEESFSILKTVHCNDHLNWCNLFVDYLYCKRGKLPSSKQTIIILFETDIILCPC